MATREQLLARIARLPDQHLLSLTRFLDSLEKQTPQSSPISIHSSWPHAPLHRLSDSGTYIVTSGTLHKQHLFSDPDRLDLLQNALLKNAAKLGWQVEAWAVFSNHYHFIAHASAMCTNLMVLVKALHAETAREINALDRAPGRQVWHNYWDTRLTFEKSYLARLNYVHQNPIRHGLVPVANQYPWCSAAWFERTASPVQVKTIYSFKIDRLRIEDDFQPIYL